MKDKSWEHHTDSTPQHSMIKKELSWDCFNLLTIFTANNVCHSYPGGPGEGTSLFLLLLYICGHSRQKASGAKFIYIFLHTLYKIMIPFPSPTPSTEEAQSPLILSPVPVVKGSSLVTRDEAKMSEVLALSSAPLVYLPVIS